MNDRYCHLHAAKSCESLLAGEISKTSPKKEESSGEIHQTTNDNSQPLVIEPVYRLIPDQTSSVPENDESCTYEPTLKSGGNLVTENERENERENEETFVEQVIEIDNDQGNAMEIEQGIEIDDEEITGKEKAKETVLVTDNVTERVSSSTFSSQIDNSDIGSIISSWDQDCTDLFALTDNAVGRLFDCTI